MVALKVVIVSIILLFCSGGRRINTISRDQTTGNFHFLKIPIWVNLDQIRAPRMENFHFLKIPIWVILDQIRAARTENFRFLQISSQSKANY